MRFILRLTLLLVILPATALLAAAWVCLSDTPLVAQQTRLSHQDIARAKAILKHNDPRRLPAGSRHSVDLDEKDLNLAANYLLQKYIRGHLHIRLLPDLMAISASIELSKLPLRRFLNLRFSLQPGAEGLRIAQLTIGDLQVPDPLAQWLLSLGLRRAHDSRQFRLASDIIKDLQLRQQRVRITYEWHPELLAAVRSEVLAPALQSALAAYQQQLLALREQGLLHRGSLTSVLTPLFQLALARSQAADGEPVLENQALLLLLGSWASGQGMGQLLPTQQRLPPFRLTLQRRRDFAQHFLVSAALAAAGDSNLSHAVGLFKELSDSQGGSGFSFTDIAADRAGTRFGGLAVASDARALWLQQQIARGIDETDIIPDLHDLPEYLTVGEFERRFKGPDDPAYRALLQAIDRRIDACLIYRQRSAD